MHLTTQWMHYLVDLQRGTLLKGRTFNNFKWLPVAQYVTPLRRRCFAYWLKFNQIGNGDVKENGIVDLSVTDVLVIPIYCGAVLFIINFFILRPKVVVLSRGGRYREAFEVFNFVISSRFAELEAHIYVMTLSSAYCKQYLIFAANKLFYRYG